MAALRPRPGNRLFRTYGPVASWGPRPWPGRAAAQWFSPQDRKHLFSSSSSNNASSSCPSESVVSDDSDDPDFRGSPVRPRRRRPCSRIPKDLPSLVVTPRHLRLRARPPQKCSTPCSPLGPPPFPDCNPGLLSPDLSVCSQRGDADEQGTSASLFSAPTSPRSPSPTAPATPGDDVICVGGSATMDPASRVPGDARCPDPASPPWTRKAAAKGGRLTRAALRSALFQVIDSENSEFGATGKTLREACSKSGLVGDRLGGAGLSNTRKTRATARRPVQDVRMESEAASGYKGRTRTGEIKRPERTRPSLKRKHQEVAETSLLHDRPSKKGQKRQRKSFVSQNSTQSQDSCSWARTRASLSFHKKKIVTAVTDVGSVDYSASESLLSEYTNHSIVNRTNSAHSAWHSSSMYLLSPLNTLHIVDQKTSHAEKVFGECSQEGPVPFSCCLPTEKLEHCEKIGEGVFGEVFRTITNCAPVALKIIAIEGHDLVNGSHQKTFEEILPEIIISKELSLLSQEAHNRTEGFIGLNSVHCVQGTYPPLLLRAWDHYNSTKGSANDRPDFFDDHQLFIVLEFEFGGTDLERMRTQLSSIATAKSILHQITASLAVAEASLHFEHRDLHWGNVLLKKTNLQEIDYTLNGKTSTIPTRGVLVNIIDYTLSHLERDGIVVFCDISMDEDLFTGEGDYQFEIYRLMRKENNNCWGEYHPYNNVLWLHYLTDKILKEVNYKHKNTSSTMKQVKQEIQHFYKTMLNFRSATELLCQHSLFK
ncbi:PREDICTED: serine/threonine-protein kinase haspin [Elephantulus edwardii]|uniref:serine/threonine-protein kinase haspin n=1 Tax=Elephantulus edwardii TaxID=28737 RepID=UPI0003F0EA51|nr:PREDICTED: serine/threonine-protein kinase haspin [Elephantulus edwardii]